MLRTCGCTDKPSTRIKVADFAEYVDRMTQTEGFSQEFKVLRIIFNLYLRKCVVQLMYNDEKISTVLVTKMYVNMTLTVKNGKFKEHRLLINFTKKRVILDATMPKCMLRHYTIWSGHDLDLSPLTLRIFSVLSGGISVKLVLVETA